MRKYDAVIFDLFGTLIDNFSLAEHEQVLSAMATVVGADHTEFVHLWLQTFDQRATGAFASTEANIAYVCQLLKLSPKPEAVALAAQTRITFTEKALVPRSDALAILTILKEKGHKLGLITDCSSEVPAIWDASPFAALIDVPVFSCAVGMRKPDPRIYRRACTALAADPQRCLYVGDGGSHELSGALRVGLDPVLIQQPKGTEHDAHRIDSEEWSGPTISSLSDVLGLV